MKVKPAQKPGGVLVELDPKDEGMIEESLRSIAPAPVFKLKKILVPMDFSTCSKKALQYAIPFAKQFNASLALLHVVPANYSYGELGAIDFAALEEQMRTGGEKELAQIIKTEIPSGIPAEGIVLTGQPGNEIILLAKKLEVDLIIISTHGYTGLKHVFMGSTTERVVRYAPCPVLTVREHEHEFVAN